MIRTRLQAQGTPAHPVYYNSPWHAVQMTYKVGGIREFYRGLGPTLLKVNKGKEWFPRTMMIDMVILGCTCHQYKLCNI